MDAQRIDCLKCTNARIEMRWGGSTAHSFCLDLGFAQIFKGDVLSG